MKPDNMSELIIYNTLGRKLEPFKSLVPQKVGMYVCGPTVYGPPHLGHVRGPIVFDVLRRYLSFKDYQVRFVRNITDVGHLVGDADEGEDKLQKQAKLEQLEPMEVAQSYTDQYNWAMDQLNVQRPSIEPKASGHIIDQIEMIQSIINKGYAYEVNGSVYFDVSAYSKKHNYGELSGRNTEDLIAGAGNESRSLEGQEEKKSPNDFALWKQATPEHIMQWTSPWGKGYPGWHIECSAMSAKYLGESFDIHGGGMDLLFPHHECEIAQSISAHNNEPARYWVHHNMITINGQKMAKSLNNGIKVTELFEGQHPLLSRGFGPKTLRFFVLQAHYRGTLDFSEEALLASEKGMKRLESAIGLIKNLKTSDSATIKVDDIKSAIFDALNDDLNTPIVIAHLFELARRIQIVNDGKETISIEMRDDLDQLMHQVYYNILGMPKINDDSSQNNLNEVMNLVTDIRSSAKIEKNYELSDMIRDRLKAAGITLMDSKEGTTWKID